MRPVTFLSGMLIFLVAAAAPLPGLDNRLPFSDHMVRHTAILLLAAPLMALSIPASNKMRNQLTGLSRLAARLPFLPWLAGIGMMWISHIPALYNTAAHPVATIVSCSPAVALLDGNLHATTVSLGLHITLLHDLGLLLAGFAFCWPLVTPYPSFRLPALNAILYLASACVFCSLLGLMITFAPAGTFSGVAPSDQQIGGLIMWVPCCFVYLSASMLLLIRWLSQKDRIYLIH